MPAMADPNVVLLAAEEGGGTSNFLIPNGTFFVVLIIFLIVLGVIGKWVVPPVSKVLRERDAMVKQTVEDSRKAADQFAAADEDYRAEMGKARGEASKLRDEARAEGRKVLEDMRGRASERSDVDAAASRLGAEGASPIHPGRPAVVGGQPVRQPWPAGCSASRSTRPHRLRGGKAMSTFIGQLVGFAVIVFIVWRYVIPPVRRMMTNQQENVRKQLADSAEAKERLAEAEKAHEKALEQAKAEAKQVTEEAQVDAQRLVEQLHAQADAEVERIKVQGAQQVQLLRAQLVRQLRQDLGAESVRRAGELVSEYVSDPDFPVGHR